MANSDLHFGFKPVKHAFGGVIRTSPYKIDSSYGTSIFTGDMVVLTSGFLAIGAHDSSVPLGVFAGCQYTAADGSVTATCAPVAGCCCLPRPNRRERKPGFAAGLAVAVSPDIWMLGWFGSKLPRLPTALIW